MPQAPDPQDPAVEFEAQVKKEREKKLKVVAIIGTLAIMLLLGVVIVSIVGQSKPTAMEACKKMALSDCSAISQGEATGILGDTRVRVFSYSSEKEFMSRLGNSGYVTSEAGCEGSLLGGKTPCDVYSSKKHLIIAFAIGGNHKAVASRLRWLNK